MADGRRQRFLKKADCCVSGEGEERGSQMQRLRRQNWTQLQWESEICLCWRAETPTDITS